MSPREESLSPPSRQGGEYEQAAAARLPSPLKPELSMHCVGTTVIVPNVDVA